MMRCFELRVLPAHLELTVRKVPQLRTLVEREERRRKGNQR